MEKEIKQVIVMRNDLNMRKGKMIAQGAHASIAFIINDRKRKISSILDNKETDFLTPEQISWLINSNQKKICVQVNSEKDLLDIYQNALNSGLIVHLITDSGLTEFNGVPTKTCLAIGPNYSEDIDRITGHLKLL